MAFGKKVLLVFSELPYPARLNGISVRYAPIITALAARHDIHVAIIARPDETRDPTGLDQVCKSVHILRRQRRPVNLLRKIATRIGKCFSSTAPYPLYSYDHAEIEQFLRGVAAAHASDLVVWVGSMHLEIGVKVFGADNIVHDAIDSLYHGHLRNRQRSIFHAIDSAKIDSWERHLINITRRTSFVSQTDAALFAEDPALARKVAVFPNGVYLDDLGDLKPVVNDSGVITVGFLGHMGYQPNIEAAVRLSKIFDLVHRQDDKFKLLIIGRDPAPEVRKLAESAGVTVTGSVDNVWEYIAKVDVFVFPMVSGAGQQNKVLEAMYGEKVVICNSLANSGVGATDQVHLLVRETDKDFADAILAMRSQRESMRNIAAIGKAFVIERYSWKNIIPLVEDFWFSAAK
jgi:glycosyltransferase involved in cell wall biosynthesis